MQISLLNLISTPIPVLNRAGLEVSVGLSSEDPMGGLRPSEAYQAVLTIYSPEGMLTDRVLLGEIPPHRRRLFALTPLTRSYFPKEDHLAVVHRIPKRLLADGQVPEDWVDLSPEESQFGMFRGLVQFSFPGGGNGSVIYEAPPGLNVRRPGRLAPNTLTFTSKIILSDSVNTTLAVMYYSMDPGHDVVARYGFSFFAPSGERIASGYREVRPFTVEVIDAQETLAQQGALPQPDPTDGLVCLSFVGTSTDAVLIPLILNIAQSAKAVAVEHSHPAQVYTCPIRPEEKNRFKARAVEKWKSILPMESPVSVG